LSQLRKSGLIYNCVAFFTHCNLLCLFCQNFDISHQGVGHEVADDELAAIMLTLQNQGCHNINFVTPSHVVPQILAALEIAVEHGLDVPLVFNSGGYDRPTTLKLLDGVFDIYMPDFRSHRLPKATARPVTTLRWPAELWLKCIARWEIFKLMMPVLPGADC